MHFTVAVLGNNIDDAMSNYHEKYDSYELISDTRYPERLTLKDGTKACAAPLKDIDFEAMIEDAQFIAGLKWDEAVMFDDYAANRLKKMGEYPLAGDERDFAFEYDQKYDYEELAYDPFPFSDFVTEKHWFTPYYVYDPYCPNQIEHIRMRYQARKNWADFIMDNIVNADVDPDMMVTLVDCHC